MSEDWGTIDIHGKQYTIVAKRVQDFREKYPDYSVITKIMSAGSEHVLVKATIKDTEGRILATGHAEEAREGSYINKTSAIENAETSAIGRALAALGYGGTSFASADEIVEALSKQQQLKYEMKGIEYAMACYRHKDVIEEMKDRLADGDLLAAAAAYMSLTNKEQMDIRKAATKGGIFTLEEVAKMKGDDWEDAKREGIKANPDVDRSI